MPLSHTPTYQEFPYENRIFEIASLIIRQKNKLKELGVRMNKLVVEINADESASADLKTLAAQAQTFISHAKVTDFIDFIENNLE